MKALFICFTLCLTLLTSCQGSMNAGLAYDVGFEKDMKTKAVKMIND